MSNLPETGAESYNWVDGVYQLEVTDPVEGGADGIANRQATQLAKRTRNLHTRTAKVESNLSDVAQGATVLSVIRGGIVSTLDTLEKLRANLAPRTAKVESNLSDVAEGTTVLSVIRGGIASNLDTLEKLRASLTLMIDGMVGGGVTAEEVYAVIRGGVDEAHDTLKELYDFVQAMTINYAKVDSSLKGKQAVTANIDLSAAGIGTITLNANTAFTFTGFQLNKNYLLIVNSNNYTPSFAQAAKHVMIEGNETLTNTGTYYINMTCIDATADAEKLLTTIVKGV